MGQPDFGQPPVFPIAQHLDHDEVDDLLAEGPIRVYQGLLDED